MNVRKMLALLAIFVIQIGAKDLRMDGNIYDSTGKGILGIKVRLAHTGLSTRTAPDGSWALVARMDSLKVHFPDTLTFGDEGASPLIEGIPVMAWERPGIVAIIARNVATTAQGSESVAIGAVPGTASEGASLNVIMATTPDVVHTVERPLQKNASVAPIILPPRRVEPQAQPPRVEAPKPEEPPHEHTKDSGYALLNWEHPIQTGAFAIEASYTRESWTGTYDGHSRLLGSPRAEDYELNLRLGTWEFYNGARSEFSLKGQVISRNQDAGAERNSEWWWSLPLNGHPTDQKQGIGEETGFTAPSLRLRMGIKPSMGVSAFVAPPIGNVKIVGTDRKWILGTGFWLSPSWNRFQLNGSVDFQLSDPKLVVHVEPQLAIKQWLAAFVRYDYDLGAPGSCDDVSESGTCNPRMLSWLEPGLRIKFAKGTGAEFAVPFTLWGNREISRWALRLSLRQVFGL